MYLEILKFNLSAKRANFNGKSIALEREENIESERK